MGNRLSSCAKLIEINLLKNMNKVREMSTVHNIYQFTMLTIKPPKYKSPLLKHIKLHE